MSYLDPNPITGTPAAIVENWMHFVQIAKDIYPGPPVQVSYIFRGHGRKDWPLQSLLAREAKWTAASTELALRLENRILREFRRQAHLYLATNVLLDADLSDRKALLPWWTLMRHHYAPTRLLDWTRSPFVAAYFAVEQHLDEPGVVWCVHVQTVRAYMSRTYGVDTIPADQTQTFLQCDAKPILYFVQRPRETDRMRAQQGIFTVPARVDADHGEILHQATTDRPKEFFRLVIAPELKLEFLRQLRWLNVTAETLFPGIDGLGRSMVELLRLSAVYED